MICYYGRHYVALVHQETGVWQRLDDARVSPVGSWDQVRSECGRGRIQPSVMFFEKVDSAAYQPMSGVQSDSMLTQQRWCAASMGPPPSLPRSQSSASPQSNPGYGDRGRHRSDQLNSRRSDRPNGMLPHQGAQWRLAPNTAHQGEPPPYFVHDGNLRRSRAHRSSGSRIRATLPHSQYQASSYR